MGEIGTAPSSPSSWSTRFAWVLATWFGCGLSPIAPGTVGTVGALPLWFALRGGGPWAFALAALVVTAVGVWAGGVVARTSGLEDPQVVVIDEVAGVLVAFAAAPPTALGFVCAFALFRLFDVTKPFPARAAERLPSGLGIMADDVVAGLQAAAVLLAGSALYGRFGGL